MDYPIGQYCIVRTENAGVFAAVVTAVDGDVAGLASARRIYYWQGAATLSELASRGTSKPLGCKFPAAVESLTVRGWIELIPISEAAKATIAAVPVWTA
jgi:hypothetical protein